MESGNLQDFLCAEKNTSPKGTNKCTVRERQLVEKCIGSLLPCRGQFPYLRCFRLNQSIVLIWLALDFGEKEKM